MGSRGGALKERFERVRVLGEGSFGVVEEAIDRERGLRVAVKSLKRLDASARDRFKAEFRGLTDLTHPNLPLFFELFTEGDDWFFTMEVVDGVPLDVWVRGAAHDGPVERSGVVTHSLTRATTLDSHEEEPVRAPRTTRADGTYSEERLRSSLAQLRDVLAFLHANGYVHRDLKPSNVRVREDGRVVLLDFGLAARVGDVEGHFVGTATYAAPEQARGGPASPAADAYALGTIVYELIAGRPPFPGPSAQILLDKQTRSAPDIRATGSKVPEDLAVLVDRWLVRDPRERAPVGTSSGEHVRELFVGRAREIDVLRAAFGAVLQGDTRVVLIEGESGIGKSALVEHVLAEIRVRAPKAQIFIGRPSPKERVPFNAFDGTLARAVHLERHDNAVAQRTAVHRAIRAILEAHASEAPVVLWIDDLQWADEDSLALLLALLRPPQLRPALFVLSRRPADASSLLVLPCARQAISLGPLEEADALALARRLGIDAARGASIAARGGGHPLFVRELCRGSTDEHAALDVVLENRIRALPEDERDLLRLLAVSQAPLAEDRLARAAKRPRGEVASSLERLRRAQLARVDPRGGVGYRTYHDRIREVLLATLGREDRVRIHEALLEALDEGDEARLEHLLGAERGEEAASVARRASSRAAEVGAYTHAAALLEEALRTGCFEGGEERALRAERVELLERAHSVREAAEEAMRVAERTTDEAEADAYRMRAARHFLATGDLERGRRVLTGVLERAQISMPASNVATLAGMLAGRAQVALALRGVARPKPGASRSYPLLRSVADGLAMTDHVRGHLFQTRALRAALASPDPEMRAEALMIEALYVGSSSAKGRTKAQRYIAAAHALFPDGNLPARAAAWELAARGTFAKHERPSLAVAAKLEEAERSITAVGGDPWWLGSVRLVRGHCLRLLGDLPRLRAIATLLAEDAEAKRDFFVLTTAHLGGLLVWLADDAPLAARQIVSQVKWPEERGTFLVQHWLGAEAEVELSLYEGRGDTLLERLGPARAFLRFSLVKRLQSVRICCNYTLGRAIVAAIAAGRASWADRLELRVLLRSLRSEDTGFAIARAAVLEAGMFAADGETERAARALDLAEREGKKAEILLEPTVAAYLRGFVEPTPENVAAHDVAEQALHALGIRRLRRFVRVIAPGFERYLPPERE